MVSRADSPQPLRVVFFGTPDFAVSTLERLLASHHLVTGVVTQPDRPRGRGRRVSASPVKRLADAHRIPVQQPVALRDPAFLAWLAALASDVGVVAAYGRILPAAVLQTPRLGLLNVHASLLPKYRGAAPIHRAIIAGERLTGVTIMRVVQALDAGPTLAQRTRPIGPDETSADVDRDLARLGAELLLEVLEPFAQGTCTPLPQDDAQASYAPRLTKADGRIDWRLPTRAVHDQVRGLHPWPHAASHLGDVRYVIHRTAVMDTRPGVTTPPGTVVESHGDDMLVATGDGRIRILEIQPEGRRPMPVRAFLAGHHVPPGSCFDGPAS